MHLGKVKVGGSYYNGQPALLGEKILAKRCRERERGGFETHLSDLTLQLFDCVKLAFPAVLCGHLVLPTSPDIATQLHLATVFGQTLLF